MASSTGVKVPDSSLSSDEPVILGEEAFRLPVNGPVIHGEEAIRLAVERMFFGDRQERKVAKKTRKKPRVASSDEPVTSEEDTSFGLAVTPTQKQQQSQQPLQQPAERSEVEKFELNLKEGLEAFRLHNMVRAAGKYETAIKLWKHNESVKSVMDADKMVVVRYAFGITAVSQEEIRSMIQEGLHVFQTMYKEALHLTCPLVLLGLCRAFVALYRFAEATEVVGTKVTAAMKEALKPLCWPLSQQVIKESQLEVFMGEMEKLRELCRCPPPPDALCFDHVDTEEGRAIYKASPTYGGLVTMSCYLECIFMFHTACWKSYKNSLSQDKLSDKEVLDKDCPTPDCGSFICSIIVDKPGKTLVSFKSDQKPVPVPRTLTVCRMKPNERTLALRQKRKDTRKQKKAEARRAAMSPDSPQLSLPQDEMGEYVGDMEAAETMDGEQPEDDAALPSTDTMVVLSKEKEKEEELKYNTFQKTVKQKKKKEKKDKAVKVNVKVNFIDNPDRERVGGYDLEEEEEEETEEMTLDAAASDDQRNTSTPVSSDQGVSEPLFVPAPPPRKPLEAFSKIVAASMPPQTPSQSRKDEDFKKSLTALLRDILKAEGPQRLGAILQRDVFLDISEEASRVIQQFGGLRQYFEKNYEFVVVGDFVGIRKDGDKVQELADHVTPSSAWSSNSVSNHSFLDSMGGPSVRTNFDPSEYNSDSVDSREMTLPTIRQGLNPSAPEFQPLGAKPTTSRMNEIDDFELGPSSRGVAPTHRPRGGSGVDSLDSFSVAADDSDVEEGPVLDRSSAVPSSLDVNDIDEIDLDPSASGSCPNLEDLNPVPAAQEGMSQRSSQSDLSQSGSDFSTGMLFRTGSPSSSMSSHKNARDVSSPFSAREVSSPFSARDVNSPALSFPSRVAADLTRQTGSPVSGAAAALPTERAYLDRSLGSGLVLGSATFFPSSGSSPSIDVEVKEDSGAGFSSSTTNIAHLNPGSLPPAPTPLKPIAPRSLGTASRLGGASTATGSAGLSSGRVGGGGVGSVSSLPLGSDGVEVNKAVERVSDSPACADATADVLTDSSLSTLTSSTLKAQSLGFTPASNKGLGLLSSSAAGDYTSPYSLMRESLPDMNLATDYTPSTSLMIDLATTSHVTAGITSSPLTLSSSLTLSSALVDEFKPSSSVRPQTYSSSSLLTWGAPLSSLHSFSSSPWSTSSATGEGASWASNSFPSSVRPDEPTANPVPTFIAHPPGSSTTTTYNIPYSNSSWSLASDTADREKDVAEKVDAEAQASVEMRSVVVCTELTSQKIVELLSQEEAVQTFYQDHRRLVDEYEYLKKEVAAAYEDRLALARQLEEQRNESQKAIQNMVNMEAETARIKEEQAARETQLMTELKNQQQKSALSGMETAGLLQKYAALEEKLRSERSRAIQAEVRVIHEQTENFKLMLGSKVRDVELLTKEAPLLVQNWQRNNPGLAVPEQQVKDMMTYYQSAHQVFTHTLDSVKGQLKEQKDQILGGKTLSDLPPVNATPPLPTQPDCLRMGPSGQPIFTPNMADVRSAVVSHPVASAAGGLQEMAPRTAGGTPPGMPPTPAPLRPPLPVQRPPGMSSAAPGLGVSKLAGVSSSQQSAAPRPLRPIGSLSKGLGGSMGRPAPPFASAARPEMRQPDPMGAAPAAGKQSSYGRLLSFLQEGFPSVPRERFEHCIKRLRDANKGSLSGLKMPDIYQAIRAMLEDQGYTCRPDRLALSTIIPTNTNINNNSSGWEVKRTAPPPGINPLWNVETLEPTVGDTYVEEEDPCVICVEELSTAEVQTLECGHRFHDHCIRTWFKQQTTCPKCRSHAPLQDDFPALK